MQRQMCWISDEELIPSSYIRAVNLFAKPMGNAFAYKPTRLVDQNDILDSRFVVFQRCRSRRALTWLLVARCTGRKTLFDIDDDLLDVPKESIPLRREERQNLQLMIENADRVTCSTAPLAEKIRQFNPNVEVVANGVQPKGKLPQTPAGPVRLFVSNTDYFKLTTSRGEFFHAITDVLQRHPKVELVVVGLASPEVARLARRFAGRVILHKSFIPNYNNYLELLETTRPTIGLVPLEESKFHSFKSNIKYLDLGAYAIPAVFSDVPPYRDSIRQGTTGLLAPNTRDGWFSAIDRLVSQPELRETIGQAAFADVAANYHQDDRLSQWYSIMAALDSEIPESAGLNRGIDAIVDHIVGPELSRRPWWKKLVARLIGALPPQVAEGDLIRDPSGRVFLIERGFRRHIVDPAVFERRGFCPTKVLDVGRLKPKGIPLGYPIEE